MQQRDNGRLTMEKGSYVLATKYSDGDPRDQWSVGFYDREYGGRHFVVDRDGNQLRRNGFRKVEELSEIEGIQLLFLKPMIENSSKSPWEFLSFLRQEVN